MSSLSVATRQCKKLPGLQVSKETDKKRKLKEKSSTIRRYNSYANRALQEALATVIFAMILTETIIAEIAAVIDITNKTIVVRLHANIKSVRVTTTNARGTSLSTPTPRRRVQTMGANIMDRTPITPLLISGWTKDQNLDILLKQQSPS